MALINLSPSKDCYIPSNVPTSNFDGAALWIGERNDSASIRRTLIQFDFSSLPDSAVITGAKLYLWVDADDRSDNARTARVYRLRRTWGETTVTWNTYDGTNSWGTAGAGNTTTDIESTDIGTASYTASESQGYKEYVLDADSVQEMFDGTFTNNGFLLKMDTENNDAYAHSNTEGVNTSNAPYLELTYENRLDTGTWTSSYGIESDSTKVSGSSNLTDFPALISDSNLSSDVYAGLRQGGSNVTATNLETSGSDANQTSYTTGSISPSPQRLVLVSVGSVQSPGTVATPTISGCGMTWTQVATAVESGNLRRTTVFRGVSDSPSTGSLTIDFGGNTQLRAMWSITEVNNVDIGGTNGSNAIVQTASNTQNDASNYTGITVTLGAFSDTKNATFGAVSCDNSGGISPGTGFTELGEYLAETVRAIQTEWRNNNDTSVDWSWSSQPSRAVAIALELKYKNQGGEDLRITTDSAGTTEVPFEIVSLDTTAETCEIWAKVPTLSYNSATSLYIWYGNSSALPYSASDTYGSQNVWRSEYKAVYHLQESSGQRNDSTSNANNLTDNNTVASGTGKIGTGADFERSNSEYLSKTDNASISTTGDFTISGWIKLEQLASSAGGLMALLSKYDFTNSDREYLLGIRNTTDKFSIFYSSLGTNTTEIQSATTLGAGNVGNFLYITAITDVSAQTTTFVINGSSESGTAVSTNATSVKDGASPLVLGANDEGRADYLDAVLDEMRLYFGLQTADWGITEYNNQNSPSTFWSAIATGGRFLGLLGVGT